MDNPDPFAPLLAGDAFEHNLNFRILRLASSLQTILQRATLRDKGVSTQEYRILVTFARHGGGHVRDVSRKASMDAAHVSRTLKAMQAKGWLNRSPHPNDKRLAMFALTEKGRDLFWSIYPVADSLAKEFSELFDQPDMIHLRDMLDHARAHAEQRLKDLDGSPEGE